MMGEIKMRFVIAYINPKMIRPFIMVFLANGLSHLGY
jgi:hypothetical protein